MGCHDQKGVEKHGVLNCRKQGTLENKVRKRERIVLKVRPINREKSLWENAQLHVFMI